MSFLLNAINPLTLPPPPESMLSEVKERLDFGRKGVGVDRGRG